MTPKRFITAATLVGFALNLGSCGGFVADHWPHWAGGLPADAPPRQGTPGYAEFISHGQPVPDAKSDAKQEPAASAAATETRAPQAPAAPALAAQPVPVRAAVPDTATDQNSNVVKGGLY